MAIEIERKFLVTSSAWRSSAPVYFCQGYLNHDKHRTVRIRIAGDRGILTVKGLTIGASRSEFEYEIPLDDAQEMLKFCDGPLVEKNRHIVQHAERTWEVDEFLGDNKGLVVAEVELASEDQTLDVPSWVGAEITNDSRYFNSNLSINPYKQWANRSE